MVSPFVPRQPTLRRSRGSRDSSACPATTTFVWDMGVANLRDLSCRDRCSERLNARLQNWHLYRFSFSFSGADALRVLLGETGSAGCTAAPATADMVAAALAGRVVMRGRQPATGGLLMLSGRWG